MLFRSSPGRPSRREGAGVSVAITAVPDVVAITAVPEGSRVLMES